MTRPLELSMYDPAWPARFEALGAEVRRAAGKHLVAVEHVGSTAVPGLLAKPTIDIAAAVASVEAADACGTPLTKRGWEHRGQHGDDPRRRYFVLERPGTHGVDRVAQLHLWIVPAAGWDRHLAFRDLLRADHALRDAYAAEKLRLIVSAAGDRRAYAEAKGTFIERALQRTQRPAASP